MATNQFIFISNHYEAPQQQITKHWETGIFTTNEHFQFFKKNSGEKWAVLVISFWSIENIYS
jgi:hypothetical protein